MTPDDDLLESHLAHIGTCWAEALREYDVGVILSGVQQFNFQDDQGPPFVANPYFVQWVGPDSALEGSALLVQPGERARLFLYRPEDYWHAPGPLPRHLEPHLDVEVHDSQGELVASLRRAVGGRKAAMVGPDLALGNELPGEVNPAPVLNRLAYGRARKTAFELACMRRASRVGARGHVAARKAFFAGASEFETHLAYLAASVQNEHATPYPNIIAQNTHASLLHYQHQERVACDPLLSLLIDAGGSDGGYASDITRTYVRVDDASPFGDLIAAMQTHQDALIAEVRPGRSFLELHEQMHRQLGAILVEHGLLECSAEQAFDDHLTEAFCPHGLGHLLGLQVHDVGGQQVSPEGAVRPPPEHYPSLRLTREIEEDQVFTIEPGLYFIPSLLAELRARGAPVRWGVVDALEPYGGIRIEDNVRVLADGVENLTRDAFAAVEPA